jgi:hypothetical protein
MPINASITQKAGSLSDQRARVPSGVGRTGALTALRACDPVGAALIALPRIGQLRGSEPLSRLLNCRFRT